jgi:cytochrome c553
MMKHLIALATMVAVFQSAPLLADAGKELLAEYATITSGPFDAERGRQLWLQENPSPDGPPRTCASCHTEDPRQPGAHPVTGKNIAPLAPAANPERLRDRREIEKWLGRNCKWTQGRACTAREKGDVLTYLLSL